MGAIKRNIPNFITCLNLLSGCIGIVLVLEGDVISGAYLMFVAAFFDFIDGLVARLLKVTSPIGKDLDSLADVVTFGVLPGMLVYKFIQMIFERYILMSDGSPFGTTDQLMNFRTKQFLLSLAAFTLPVFSAIRLARFNNDPEQSYSFKGLPTPASGLIIACIFIWVVTKYKLVGCFSMNSLKYTGNPDDDFATILLSPYFWIVIALLFSALMVSKIPLMAFKFKGFGWKANQWKYILLILCLPLVIWLKFASAPIILILYILISQIHFRTNKHEI